MARAFKELTGNITKLHDPHFVAARGLWVMMVKENDAGPMMTGLKFSSHPEC
uniref:hypothetical protein n=1 Tax=Cephaloticoccus sp. TaxID=1985742 RepID=UPI00404B08D1